MSRDASGSYTLPNSVNPAVGRTPITATWWSITGGDIATELTNSLDRQGRGAMAAPLQLSSGVVGAPGLTFSAEPTSGLYRAGAGDLRVAVGGADKLTLTSSALTIAAALAATGQIKSSDGSAASPGLTFSSDTDTGLYRAGANDLRIVTNGQDRVSFTTKVAISAATAATGGTRQDALSLNNGDLDLSAVAAPTSTTAIANRLTPTNICKAWVVFQIVGGGAPYTVTVQGGFNVASVARTSASTFTITFGSAFASATGYGPVGQVLNGLVGADQYLLNPTTRNAGSLVAGISKASAGGAVNMDTDANTYQVMVVFYGAQ